MRDESPEKDAQERAAEGRDAASTREASSAVSRFVLDPEWEESLRRARDEDAGSEVQGSVEPELATLHLLRHARAPEELDPAALEAIWRSVQAEVAPARVVWWRSVWVKWAVPAAAAAGVVAVVSQGGPAGTSELARVEVNAAVEPDAAGAPALATDEEGAARGALAPTPRPRQGSAAILEEQFELLAPRARARVGASVESGRGSLRASLIEASLQQEPVAPAAERASTAPVSAGEQAP